MTKHFLASRKISASTELSEKERQELELAVNDTSLTVREKEIAKSILQMAFGAKDVEVALKTSVHIDAKDYIISESKKYHFLLINEAHHSQQNRAFTATLLRELWKNGYRYLALETLSHSDTGLIKRGYPRAGTGTYIRDSVFGNLVREALSIGYSLIPYEAQKNLFSSHTDRDREQAQNIYNATYRMDSVGKVIVHAGFSHISEFGGIEYEPMGYQLGKLSGQEIFTVDQQTMAELDSEDAMNSFYKIALKQFPLLTPTVFLNKEGRRFVEPANSLGIDVQVFHPKTNYHFGRPSWLFKTGFTALQLPDELLEFKGHLLQAVIEKDDLESVPTDQFVIAEGRALVLRPGEYLLRIIDPKGSLVATCTLSAK
jgi:hypothetical protein